MPDAKHNNQKTAGVSRLWRTATLFLLVGIAVHFLIPTKSGNPVSDGRLTIRGDPLPTYDPRLDTRLDTVDFDKVPIRDALTALAGRIGMSLVVTPELPSPDPNTPVTVTVHLKDVAAADAMNVLYHLGYTVAGIAKEPRDVRTQWTSFDNLLYTTTYTPGSNRLYTRFYDIERILERRNMLAKSLPCATTRMSTIFNSDPQYQNWLDKVIWHQLQDRSARLSFYGNSMIATGTPDFHRHLESVLRQLEIPDGHK